MIAPRSSNLMAIIPLKMILKLIDALLTPHLSYANFQRLTYMCMSPRWHLNLTTVMSEICSVGVAYHKYMDTTIAGHNKEEATTAALYSLIA